MPSADKSFSHIKNPILRSKLVSNNNLLSFLIKTDIHQLDAETQSLFFKNIVIQISSISEILLLYIVLEHLETKYNLKEAKNIFNRFSFALIISTAKELKIIGRRLSTNCNKLRKLRNNIHLDLFNPDEEFDQKTVEFSIKVMSNILKIAI